MRRYFLIVFLFSCASPLGACLWDQDTLAREFRFVRSDVRDVLLGNFPRNPDQYYVMRIERVRKVLATNADDLAAYDDIAVACDRLGRSDEAIDWMNKKKDAMDRLKYDLSPDAQPNHLYRYYANLGTFCAHRWMKEGRRADEREDLEKGRELIATAISVHPEAHFGRERYQLRMMDWLLKNPTYVANTALPTLLDDSLLSGSAVSESTEIVSGLSGLVVLGAAWESVDIFYAMACVLEQDQKASIAWLARERCFELIRKGKGSVVKDAPDGDALIAVLSREPMSMLQSGGKVTQYFRDTRTEVEAWSNARSEYMLAMFAKGKHPDTDTAFWDGFKLNPERAEVDYGKGEMPWGLKRNYVVLALGGAVCLAAVLLFWIARKKQIANKAANAG